MTESVTTEINRVAQTLESVAKTQLELARSMQVLTERVDQVAGQIAILIDAQQMQSESQRSLMGSLDQLTSVILPRMCEQQIATAATVERLDRVLAYLLRKDQR
ncbi:hypothetical protein GS597_12525 [Synechococcales cyanobacterium C]|uniref:Uncharacterized protein n=1 Tax=Petrachloros mirabilis ULC683 TaxID=2781853 RepID=A0A8K2A057_9CYAN|nr:hypothetical protein [Petrachloros mirabilis]NCJ07317.1 hypothetical protein [Petrachloros mirabilis ULC683]